MAWHLYESLCHQADDVWLYWMMRLKGDLARRVPDIHYLHSWPNTQKMALFHNNVGGKVTMKKLKLWSKHMDFPHNKFSMRL